MSASRTSVSYLCTYLVAAQAAESSNEESHRAQDEAADGVNAQADINGKDLDQTPN